MTHVLRHTLLGAALSVSIALGQVASGSIAGQVRDETGGALTGARVVARQESTGFTRSAVSDGSGDYRIEQMAPGTYSIEAQRDGFRTAVASHITIEVQQQAQLDFSLKVGGAHDAVEVRAKVSPLQTQDSAVGYRIDSNTLTQLPLDERNVNALVTLGPGAIPRQLGGLTHDVDNDQQQGTRGSVALNPPINGARPSMNSFLLDGAYDTDRNAFAIVVTPPMEAVQEFRIQSSLAAAPFAQSGGGVMDVITKSGGREFHGNAFEYFRNEITDARSYFDDPTLPRPPYRRNQYGGSLGGRLPVPSTFFFVTYEGLRSKSATPSLQLVPGMAMRGGDFSQGNAIYDPLSAPTAAARSPFPGNVIPADQIDPIARKYLALYEPLPNRPNNPSSNYLDSSPSSSNHDEVSARIDHQFTKAGLLFGRYTINEETGGIGGSFPLRPTSEKLRAQQAVVGHTIGGASWSNELRASFTRLRLFDVPINSGNVNIAAQLGISNPPTDPASFGLPYFFLTDFSTVTDDPTLPQIQRDNTWDTSDTVSLVRGRHTFKFGADWIHFQMNYRQSNSVRGQYTYDGAFTGNGDTANTGDALADFLLGFPEQSQRTVGNSLAYLRENTASGFAQDEWQVEKSLTVTLGVRYEYTSPFTEANGNLYNLDYSNLPQPPTLVNVNSAYDPNLHDFAPRAGLAWRLPGALSSHGETVFRAGYGIYYSPEIAVDSYDLALNRLINQSNETDGNSLPILTTQNGFPTTSSTGFPSYFGLDRHLPTPYVQQWNGGFQRELPGAVVFEASYIGSKGTHLGRFRRFNTALHTETGENLNPRPGDLQSLRTFPTLGPIIQREHIANSSYNSLQLKAEKRFAKSLSFLGSFVWSKSIDDADSVIPGLFASSGAQDERNLRLERGLSFFNVGRRISADFVYRLPSPRERTLRLIAGGWELSGLITIQDGTPLDPLYSALDIANAGTFNRPNVVPGQSVSLPANQRTPEHWFNTAAFSQPAPYTFGNAGRDIIPGPGNEVIDLALHKRFAITERLGLEFRTEGFNVFNHPNFGIPDPYPDNGPFFGRILTSGQPRRLQFAARLEF